MWLPKIILSAARQLPVAAIDVAHLVVAFPIGIGIASVKGVTLNYIKHDASRLPVAANVRVTEDAQEFKPGDGVWKAAQCFSYRQSFVDLPIGSGASNAQFSTRSLTAWICSS